MRKILERSAIAATALIALGVASLVLSPHSKFSDLLVAFLAEPPPHYFAEDQLPTRYRQRQ